MDNFREAVLLGEMLGTRCKLAVPQTPLVGTPGGYTGRLAGSSIEFKDFREYHPGDDIRRIDWGAYARSDRLNVKQFHEEIRPRLEIILDGSLSMNISNKAEVSWTLVAMLATAASKTGCTHDIWICGRDFASLPNSEEPPKMWEIPLFESNGGFMEAFTVRPPSLQDQSIRVIIGDLLLPDDPAIVLQTFAMGASALYLIQVLSAEDSEPLEYGNICLSDSENDDEMDLFVDRSAVKRFMETLRRHQDIWHDACARTGARMMTLVSEDFSASGDLTPLVEGGVIEAG